MKQKIQSGVGEALRSIMVSTKNTINQQLYEQKIIGVFSQLVLSML